MMTTGNTRTQPTTEGATAMNRETDTTRSARSARRTAAAGGAARALAALAFGCVLVPGLAAAEPNAWYVGGGVGQSSFRSDLSAQINRAYEGSGFTVDSARVSDNSDTGWKVFGGWQFHRNAAVELGYVDFGRATSHYEVVVPGQGTAIRDGKYRLSGVELSVLAIAPVGERASVFAKAGALASKLEYSESGVDQFGASTSFSADDNSVRFAWGLGGTVNFTPSLAARIEWQRVEKVGERFALTTTGNGEFDHVDLVSASIVWRFR